MKNIKTYALISVFLLAVLVMPNFSLAATTEEIQAQIKSLMAQIEALKAQLAQIQSQNTAWCHDFNRNLKIEEKGEEIAMLQTVLEKEGFAINEDEKSQSYFGESTASAVVGLQEKYNEDILKPFGLKYGTGFVGKFTRLKLNNLYGCSVSQGPTSTSESSLTIPATTSSVTPTPTPTTTLATTTSSITVLSPNGGEVWEAGKTYTITWSQSNIDKVTIYLMRNSSLTEATVVSNYSIPITYTSGSYAFTIPSIAVPVDTYKIWIIGYQTGIGQAKDWSDAPFSIVASETTSSLTVLYPNGGISMPQTGSLMASAKIVSSKTNGTLSWYLIGEKSGYKRLVTVQNFSPTSSNNTAYATIDFPTSTPVGSDYKVKVDWVSSDGLEILSDMSDNFFSVTLLAPTIVLSPNGGETWNIGSTQTIKWTTQSSVSVLVDLYKGNIFIKRLSNGYTGGTSLSVNVGSDLVPGNDYKIKIQTSTLSINDWSDAPFSIVATTITNPLLNVSLASDTIQNTVIAGIQQNIFTNYNLSAINSTEDVSVTSIQLSYQGSGNPTGLTNCRLYDGSTILNTDVNVVNPSSFSQYLTFYLGTGSKVTKGTIKKITLKCDINSNASGFSYQWGIDAAAKISAVGVSSGNVASYTITGASGTVVNIISSGALSVSLDASTPAYYIAAGNTTGNVLSVLKLSATNEPIQLKKITLGLGVTTLPQDLTQVTLWDGSVQVGTAIFTGSNKVTSSILSGSFVVPANSSKILTIKGDISAIDIGQPGTSGHLIQVYYDGDTPGSTYGIGMNSGIIINSSTYVDIAGVSVMMMKSFPVFTKLSVPTNTLTNGNKILYRFKLSANSAGSIGLYSFTAYISGSNVTLSNINAYAYTDSSFSMPVFGLSPDGGMLASSTSLVFGSYGFLNIYAQTVNGINTTVQIPAGSDIYFEIRASVSNVAANSAVSTRIFGDSGTDYIMRTAQEVDATKDFVWSPNSTGISVLTSLDWTNGYGISGLHPSGTPVEILSVSSSGIVNVSETTQMANILNSLQKILKQLASLLKK